VTRRAVLLGVGCGVFIAGFGYLNDWIFRLNYLVGNHMPISVFAALMLVLIGLNPALRRLRPGWELRPAEQAVILALILAGCAIPGSGLMREFTQIMAMPAHYNRTSPDWQKNRVMEYAPKRLLLNDGQHDEHLHGDYLNGVESNDTGRILDFGAVPWKAWLAPLAAWTPIILLFALACFCLALIVHPQWSRRELLAYPLAVFARAVITGRTGSRFPPLLRNRAFWCGLGIVLAVRILNGMQSYFPEYVIPVQMRFDLRPLADIWPQIRSGAGWSQLLRPMVFPTVVALAFFLTSEVSLSLGLTQLLAVPLLALFAGYGINVQPGQLGAGLASWQMFGSYLAMFFSILYIGRHYYLGVLRESLRFGKRQESSAERYAVRACRVLIPTILLLVLALQAIGLNWSFALVFVGLSLMMFTVTSRISAEAGLPHIETNWNALTIMTGLFGAAALGPAALLAVGVLSAMLLVDVRESLMPFVVNGLKIGDDQGVRPARIGRRGLLVFGLGFALAVPVVLAAMYTCGVPLVDRWGSGWVPKWPFAQLNTAMYQLQATGSLAEAEGHSTLGRWLAISPQPGFLWAVAIGAGLVLLFMALRLRAAWWPLHPIIFLTWTTWPLMNFSSSFLLGWLLKRCLTRYGGQRLVAATVPFMIGVIAGDLLGGALFMAVGALYYIFTGTPAPIYRIFTA